MRRNERQRREERRQRSAPVQPLRPTQGQGMAPERQRLDKGKGRSPRDRARKRRRRLMAFYLILFFSVVTAAVILSLTVLFKIDTIEITGTSRYSQEEILKISGIVKGENLFLAKTAEAEGRLEKQLPYIGQAVVSRKFPAKIIIQVEEAQVVGGAAIGASYALVTEDGKSLELVKTLPAGCTELRGLNLASAEPGEKIVYQDQTSEELFTQVVKAVADSGLDKVTKIDISDPYGLLVVYDNRITMTLGPSNDLDYKMRFGAKILISTDENGEKRIADSEVGVLKLATVKEDNRAYFDPEETVFSQPPVTSIAPESSDTGGSSSAQASKAPET